MTGKAIKDKKLEEIKMATLTVSSEDEKRVK